MISLFLAPLHSWDRKARKIECLMSSKSVLEIGRDFAAGLRCMFYGCFDIGYTEEFLPFSKPNPEYISFHSHLYLPLQPGLGVAAVEEEDGDAGVGEGPLGAGRGRRHPRRRPRRVVQVGHAAADGDGGAVAAEASLDRPVMVL